MEKMSETELLKRIKTLILDDQYAQALEVLKDVDVSRLKNPPVLCLVGEVYMHEKQYEAAEEVLLRAYERSPKNRRILDLTTSLYIEMGEYSEAEYYYKEFISVASRDVHRYILRYRLDKGKGERLSVLIDTLEQLKDYEYIEEWAYELATLYEAAGEEKKCIHECDEIVLWFGHGEYVDKAIALKCKLTGQPLPKVTTVEMEQQEERAALEKQEQEAKAQEEQKKLAQEAKAQGEQQKQAQQATAKASAKDAKKKTEETGKQSTAASLKAARDERSLQKQKQREEAEAKKHVIDPDNALESAGEDTGIDVEMIRQAMEEEQKELHETESAKKPQQEAPKVKKKTVEEDKAESSKLMDDILRSPGLDKVKNPDKFKQQSADQIAAGTQEESFAELEAMLDSMPEKDLQEEDLEEEDDDDFVVEDETLTGLKTDAAFLFGSEESDTQEESQELKSEDLFEQEVQEVNADADVEETAGEEELQEEHLETEAKQEMSAEQQSREAQASADWDEDSDELEYDTFEDEEESFTGEAEEEETFDDRETEAEEAHTFEGREVDVETKEAEAFADTQPRKAQVFDHTDDDELEVQEALDGMTEDQDEVLLEQAMFGGVPAGDTVEDVLDDDDEYMDSEEVQVHLSDEDEQFLSELFSSDESEQKEESAEESTLSESVKNIFATVPNVKNVHQQLAKTMTQFETAGTDYDVLAPYDINFVVMSDDKGMKSQIAIGIAKALNTYGVCDKNKIVRATAQELNQQDFSSIFSKITGGCLIVDQADQMSDATVKIIEAEVYQENQQVAIILESRQKELTAFWKKHPRLRGKFLNVINVSKYNEMELVTLAKNYIEKRGYELSPEAAIVLRDYFKKSNQDDLEVGYEDTVEVIDEAIANLDKRNRKNLFMTVLDNKYEEADMLKILPEDFEGVLTQKKTE